jgi:hypothetical protein
MKQKLVLLVILVLFLIGCSENEKFIQGMWYTRSEHLNVISGETYLEIRWAFSDGTFEYHSCCFTGELYAQGRYRILKNEGNKITLELFNVQGDGSFEGAQVVITIDEKEDTLKMVGGGEYVRLEASD